MAMRLNFSIIIPVYNRPIEVEELLNSLTKQSYNKPFEIIIVEDGSNQTCQHIVENYKSALNVHYFFKLNSGAGASRNFGMSKAEGNYFLIFDSDCIIPKHYLDEVEHTLTKNFTDAFGGPDLAHKNFSNFQKAVSFSMTSFVTTGGIRGRNKSVGKFQPRSFNMGISKAAFEKTGGFNQMKTGEDIDLTFRLWQSGFSTQFIAKAYVYHKRRANSSQFIKQTFSFGKARPFLNRKYPQTSSITYWFPTLFTVFFAVAVFTLFFGFKYFFFLILIYFLAVFTESLLANKSIIVAILSIYTTCIQFFGYGSGFVYGLLKEK